MTDTTTELPTCALCKGVPYDRPDVVCPCCNGALVASEEMVQAHWQKVFEDLGRFARATLAEKERKALETSVAIQPTTKSPRGKKSQVPDVVPYGPDPDIEVPPGHFKVYLTWSLNGNFYVAPTKKTQTEPILWHRHSLFYRTVVLPFLPTTETVLRFDRDHKTTAGRDAERLCHRCCDLHHDPQRTFPLTVMSFTVEPSGVGGYFEARMLSEFDNRDIMLFEEEWIEKIHGFTLMDVFSDGPAKKKEP